MHNLEYKIYTPIDLLLIDGIFDERKKIAKERFLSDFQKFIRTNINKGNNTIKYSRLRSGSKSIIYYPKKATNETQKSILLVSHELSRTGAPVVLLDAAKILVKEGYFVVVVSPNKGDLIDDFLEIGVPVIVMAEMYNIWLNRMETTHFVDFLELDTLVENFDLTIMNTLTMYNFVRRYFNTDYKIIWWLHEGTETYNGFRHLVPKTITPNVRVVCAGEYALNKNREEGLLYYPQVLNYGVYDERNKVRTRIPNDDKVRFVMVGTVQLRKNQAILLEAIKRLSPKYKENAEFLFVGNVPPGDEEGKRVKNEIIEYGEKYQNVFFRDFMPREELYQVYLDSDVLIVPSIDDPMPVVATENFMLEKVVLCSNQTGTYYYVEDSVNGFVFNSGDPDALKVKIEYIIDHKDKIDEIGKKGREIYDNYFRIDIFERNLKELIREVL